MKMPQPLNKVTTHEILSIIGVFCNHQYSLETQDITTSLITWPLLRVLLSELLRILEKLLLVLGVLFCQVCPEGMVRFRRVDKGYQSLDHLISLDGRLPVLGRHNWQADLALLVNVWVVDLCAERHPGGFEGVLFRENNVDQESSLVVWGGIGNQQALPHKQVGLVHLDVSEGFWRSLPEVCKLLLQSPGSRHSSL